ncbi:hypothetical protein BXY66_2632 [Shimia isoporae]|uniref:Uncharacterized protein n=1 Tax=Shimia isoporae TaxID=647720 RepID=A0A4R1NB30_9RHOB|nr:hypothetical protein BXY66_2632 [Shimia isoporae]
MTVHFWPSNAQRKAWQRRDEGNAPFPVANEIKTDAIPTSHRRFAASLLEAQP